MSKDKTLTHNEREQLKKDYRQAHRLVLGYEGFIEYRRGWWYLMSGPVAIPFSTKEIEAKIDIFRKRIPPRIDSDDDGNPD
jgi:hypothetical protein